MQYGNCCHCKVRHLLVQAHPTDNRAAYVIGNTDEMTAVSLVIQHVEKLYFELNTTVSVIRLNSYFTALPWVGQYELLVLM